MQNPARIPHSPYLLFDVGRRGGGSLSVARTKRYETARGRAAGTKHVRPNPKGPPDSRFCGFGPELGTRIRVQLASSIQFSPNSERLSVWSNLEHPRNGAAHPPRGTLRTGASGSTHVPVRRRTFSVESRAATHLRFSAGRRRLRRPTTTASISKRISIEGWSHASSVDFSPFLARPVNTRARSSS